MKKIELVVTALNKVVASISEEEFFEGNNIDPEEMSYLGKGDFGEAYDVGGDRVLKKTSSRSEYRIAQQNLKEKIDGFAEVYAIAEIKGTYYIILELLDVEDIEDVFVRFNSMLGEQEVPIQYMSHFDEEDYIEAGGDEVVNGKIDPELLKFMAELEDVVRGYSRLGIEASDIRSENLGRDKKGKLKAFDIDDRSPKSHWK